MPRRALYWAVALALVAGCGESTPHTPQQLVSMGRFDEAIEASTQALRADPRDAQAYLYRGRAYHCRNAAGDLARAVADFSASIEIAPNEAEPYYSRSLAYRDQGLAEKSAADVRLAREHDARLQEIYAQIPSPSMNSKVEQEKGSEKTAEATSDKSSADHESESEPENGTRTQAERREAQKKAVSSATGPELKPFDIKTAAPVRTKQQILESVRKEAAANSSILDDEFPSDDELLGKKTAPPGKESASPRSKSTDRRRVDVDRFPGPLSSPFQPRSSAMAASGMQPPPRRPVQSPFPQRAPRPTGFVEEQPQGAPNAPARRLYDNPYSVPAVRLPGAYHDDFNP